MERNCENCGTTFTTYPSRIKRGGGRYCSQDCVNAASVTKGRYERTPEHRARMSAERIGKAPVAAIEAAVAVNKQRLTGAGNPKWIDGRTYERYGPGFISNRALRAFVVERDRVCQDCGEWDARPRQMQMHHIDEDKNNHDPENLVLLCVKCHNKRHLAAGRQ